MFANESKIRPEKDQLLETEIGNMDWIKRLYSDGFRRPVTEKELVLKESIGIYLQNMEKEIPEHDDECLIDRHNTAATKAFDDFRDKPGINEDDHGDFEVNVQEAFMDILDSNWTKNEAFCRDSMNAAEGKILNYDYSDDGQSEADNQNYWNLMKQIQTEYVAVIGDSLLSRMNHVRLEYLDERQGVDYDVFIDQWKKQNDALMEAALPSNSESNNTSIASEADDDCNDDKTCLVTDEDSNSGVNPTSPGETTEEVFSKQVKLQMTWGRLLIFWKYWMESRRETLHLLREISEFLKGGNNRGDNKLILNRVLYQHQSHVGDPSDIYLDDFPRLSLKFTNVINKDIRCYQVLLRKLQDFLELVTCRDYLDTFHVDPGDIFLNITMFQQDVSVENNTSCGGLEICKRILERQRGISKGTSWLLESTARPLVHLRDLFRKLDDDGRLNPDGLDGVIKGLAEEDTDMDSMFFESLQSFMDVSSKVSRAFEELCQGVREWSPKRDETIARLKEIAEKLHKTTKDVAISQTVGSSAGLLGGLIVIGGLVLSPVTLGLSLIPSLIAGGVIGSAGALTAIGSSVAEIIIDKDLVQQATASLEEDKGLTDILAGQIRDFNAASSLLLRYIPQDELENFVSFGSFEQSSENPNLAATPEGIGPRLGITVTRLVTVGGKAIAIPLTRTLITGTVAASRMVALALAHGIAAIGIGLDIANIVLAAIKLGKGAKSEDAIKLEEAVADLENGKREITDVYLGDHSNDS